MKNFLLLFLIFSFSISKAQLKVGSVAPNITLTDLNGNSHNLYNYLDSGVTVIFDIFAVWCGPCKNFRKSHVFDSLELHYGMKGNISPGKIKILAIECEGAPLDQVLSYSKGTNYSYVTFKNFNAIYPCSAIPQFYVICPNRIIAYDKPGAYPDLFVESSWLQYVDYCPQQLSSSSKLNSAKGVKIGPNPVSSGYLTIDISGMYTSDIKFVVFDFMGRQIQRIEPNEITGDSYKLDTDNLTEGIYFVQVITGNQKQSFKFIKE